MIRPGNPGGFGWGRALACIGLQPAQLSHENFERMPAGSIPPQAKALPHIYSVLFEHIAGVRP
jgi:hypothetical protein